MYALANVEKFLDDNKAKINPQQRSAILKRARQQANPNGILVAGMAEALWRDDGLLKEFGQALNNSVEHMEIGVAAISAAHHS